MTDPDNLMSFLMGRSVRDLQSRVEELYNSLPTEEEFYSSSEEDKEVVVKKVLSINSLLEEWVLDEEERELFSPF